ncbi:MAG: hypothetical protein COA52_08405 [Hyphomicrobiales bacterium]|nr:MAG: hypothetical protein COA52_08405 [Hyphomicrobiales bacterium]
MTFINAASRPDYLAPSRFISNSEANPKPENIQAGTTKQPVENAPKAANISAPLVSSSVQSTLLRLQETGSVFDDKDSQLMNIRGVNNYDRARFAELIVEASEKGGYNNPVAYIKSLPKDDIQLLMRVHSLAEPRGVTNTDVEGAYNLLLPKSDHVDSNRDGLVNTGAATGFYFPPPNSPQSVKDAWEETIKDMSLEDRMMAEGQFMMASIGANLKLDGDGNVVGIYDHTDPEYTNVFPTSKEGWDSFLKEMIENLSKAVKRSPELATYLDMMEEFAGNSAAAGNDVG